MKAVSSEEEEADENAGVESARLAERETEAALRGLRHAQIRSKRTDVKTHRRGYREATVEKKLKFGSAESMEGVKHAESVKNAEQKRYFYNRFFQKKRYKDAYRAARAGKSAGSLGGATTIAGVENMTVKAKIALKEIIKRNRAMFAGIGIFALLFLVIAVSLGSCSASIEGAGSVIGITTYPSSDEDIYAAENRYAAFSTFSPVSSSTSRATPSSPVSYISINPPERSSVPFLGSLPRRQTNNSFLSFKINATVAALELK